MSNITFNIENFTVPVLNQSTNSINTWDLINQYCTNLNNHLIYIVWVMFIFYIILDINKYLKDKNKYNLYDILLDGYLRSQYLFFVYFVYAMLSKLGIMPIIARYYIVLSVIVGLLLIKGFLSFFLKDISKLYK